MEGRPTTDSHVWTCGSTGYAGYHREFELLDHAWSLNYSTFQYWATVITNWMYFSLLGSSSPFEHQFVMGKRKAGEQSEENLRSRGGLRPLGSPRRDVARYARTEAGISVRLASWPGEQRPLELRMLIVLSCTENVSIMYNSLDMFLCPVLLVPGGWINYTKIQLVNLQASRVIFTWIIRSRVHSTT